MTGRRISGASFIQNRPRNFTETADEFVAGVLEDRYDLAAMLPRLTWAAVRTPPMPYRLLKLAEVSA